MLRKEKGDPALSGAVGPWGAGAANRLALRTRGGAGLTWKVQQVKMQRCFLAHCLRAAWTLTLHCTHTLRLPTTLELQPFPSRRCRTQVLTMPSPPSVHSQSGHLPKRANTGRIAELLLPVCMFCHLLLPPLQTDCGRESCRLGFRVTFLISEERDLLHKVTVRTHRTQQDIAQTCTVQCYSWD